MFKISFLRELLEDAGFYCDTFTFMKKEQCFRVRRGFFYTHGKTAEDFASQLEKALTQIFEKNSHFTIIDSGEIWKSFSGGAPVAQQSHWYVDFILNPGAKLK